MPRGYLFKREDRDEPGKPVQTEHLNAELRNRFPADRGQRRIRILRDGDVEKDWGPWKDRGEIIRNIEHQLENGKVGDVVQVETRRDGFMKRVRIVRLPEELDGRRVLAAIRSVWGAPYVFGGENGPGGEPGVFFDCSGLVDWAHNTVDVDLPHGSELIRRDPRVTLFKREEQRLCKPGDLVIMHFGRLAAGVADHIGVWRSAGVMLDTRSPYDPVGSSPIEIPNVMSFGRIAAVNGKLR